MRRPGRTDLRFSRTDDGLYVYQATGAAREALLATTVIAGQRDPAADAAGRNVDRIAYPGGNWAPEEEFRLSEQTRYALATVYDVDTVQSRSEGLTPTQISRAQQARRAQAMMGYPSDRDFMGMMRLGLVQNCPVTTEDVVNADRVYGPDVALLKGKTARSAPLPAVGNSLELPPELRNMDKTIDLAGDIFFVMNKPFLITKARRVMFITAESLPNRTKGSIKASLLRVLQFYSSRGFRVRSIFMDGEFAPLQGQLGATTVDVAASNEHVGDIENLIRHVKNRYRALRAGLPYKQLPYVVSRYLIRFIIMWLNAFPPRGGVSRSYGPRTVVLGTRLDYKLHCRLPFGAYAQVHDVPDPRFSSSVDLDRTTGGISLGPSGNQRGGYYFYNLNTGRVVTRYAFTPLPIPSPVIDRVHELAAADKVPAQATFTDRLGRPFSELLEGDDEYDAASAGVGGGAGVEPPSFSDDGTDGELDEDSDDEVGPEDAENGDDETAGTDDEPDDSTTASEDEGSESGDDDGEAPAGGDAPIIDDDGEEDDGGEPPGVEGAPAADDDGAPNPGVEGAPAANPGVGTAAGAGAGTTLRSGRVSVPPRDYEPSLGGKTYEVSNAMWSRPSGLGAPAVDAQGNFSAVGGTKPIWVQHPPSHHRAFQEVMRRHVNLHTMATVQHTGRMALVTLDEDDPLMSPDQWAAVTHFCMTQYSFKAALRKFPGRTEKAVGKELLQLHNREVYRPLDASKLSPQEKRNALESIMTVKEKRTGDLKGRFCVNGSKQRGTIPREEAASPTVNLDSVFLTAAIDAHEGRDVAVVDLPGAYLSVKLEDPDTVDMVLRGTMAELMALTAPQVYRQYVTVDARGQKVLYVRLQRALYGLLKSALLFYRKLWTDLSGRGFEVNPYDPCVANMSVNGKQLTVCWHVDDLKMSHMDEGVLTDLIGWLEKKYGELRISRGQKHEYLGMEMDFSSRGEVKFGMDAYVKGVCDDFPEPLGRAVETPAGDRLFDVREEKDRQLLSEEDGDVFHRKVAQLLFVSTRARRDIRTAVAFLCTRVKEPDRDDWNKLKRVLRYLRRYRTLKLTIRPDDLSLMHWWVDASFAVHADFKGHTGGVMSWGRGAVVDLCRKQKVNTMSSTEAEVVGVSDVILRMTWVHLFVEAQGYASQVTLHQDNEAAMRLEINGRRSCGQRTRHLHIRYFYITDQVEQGWVKIRHCPTEAMVGDFFTKPLQGAQFRKLRAFILNCPEDPPPDEGEVPEGESIDNRTPCAQECVGRNVKKVKREGATKLKLDTKVRGIRRQMSGPGARGTAASRNARRRRNVRTEAARPAAE